MRIDDDRIPDVPLELGIPSKPIAMARKEIHEPFHFAQDLGV